MASRALWARVTYIARGVVVVGVPPRAKCQSVE
jgi:hypothetical protein